MLITYLLYSPLQFLSHFHIFFLLALKSFELKTKKTLYSWSFKWYCLHFFLLNFTYLHTLEETERKKEHACWWTRVKVEEKEVEKSHFRWPQSFQEVRLMDKVWLSGFKERGSSLKQPLGDSDRKLTTNN